MVTHHEIERQLRAIGTKITWWGRGEASELEHVIEPGETIMYCINGWYENGFAMLCITDQRAVLIDKKPMFLTLEDIRYDMVSEVDFDGRLVNSAITICTVSKKLRFASFNGTKLRQATAYLQRRVMELRQQQFMAQQFQLAEQQKDGIVKTFEHRIINPYAKMPLLMRRRVSRFYGDQRQRWVESRR